MVKSILATAMVCACAAANAETSYTLYGMADINIEYVNSVGNVPLKTNGFDPGEGRRAFREDSGGYSGSRIGFKGTEDLGDGLKAVFVLEGGIGIDTGLSQQGGRLFGRQAFVGLKSELGQLTFGRQYSAIFSTMGKFLPGRYAIQYEPANLISGVNFRQNNTAKYIGEFGPLTVLAHWSFGVGTALPQVDPNVPGTGGDGQVPGQFRRDSAFGAGANYVVGPLGLGIAYDQWNPTINGADTARFKKLAVMANYTFSDTMKVMGGYRWGQNKDQNGGVMLRDDFYWVGGQYQVSPQLEVTLEYDYQNIKSVGGRDAANPWQLALMTSYKLSKRTNVYLTTAYSKNAGLTLDSAANSYATSLTSRNSYVLPRDRTSMFGAAVGIRHLF